MPQLLLVHGAWHGAWCWERVVALLDGSGVVAHALDLPGHGESSAPLDDLHGDADAVRRRLDDLDAAPGSVVLVGHSYGGAVVTEAGVHPAVGHLVYIAGFALDRHESCTTAGDGDPEVAGLGRLEGPTLADVLVRGPESTVLLDPERAPTVLYHDADAASVAWAVARIDAQRSRTLKETPGAVAWRHVPSTYAVCAHDRAVHPGLQRILARRCTDAVELPTGHSPMLVRPDVVAALLAAATSGLT